MKKYYKYLIFCIFLFSSNTFSNALHESIRACDDKMVETLLGQGKKYSEFKPDAIDAATQESTLDALEKCSQEDKKLRIKNLLEECCTKYQVRIPTGSESFYPASISNKTAPAFSRGFFIKTKEINHLFLPEPDSLIKRVGKTSQAIKIGPYFVLKQQNSKGCGPATVLMRQMDLEIAPSTVWFANKEETIEPDLVQEFLATNIDTECVSFQGARLLKDDNEVGQNIAEYLQENLAKRGPAIINGFNQNGGGHWFIVDELQLDREKPFQGYAIIRDPWHGWRINISQKAFLDSVGLDKHFASNRDDEWGPSMLHLI